MMDNKNHASTATFPDILEEDDEEVPTFEENKPDEPMANRPHPSLDFPPLYFALKRWPWLSKPIKRIYQIRWRLSYPLQRKLPYSKTLRKIGISASWGEALLLLPFLVFSLICFFYTAVQPDVAITGKMARFGLIAAIVFGQKNSLLTLFLGLPFDRALFYHKVAGYNAFVNGLLHTWAFAYVVAAESDGQVRATDAFFEDRMTISGTLLLLLLSSLLLSSLPKVRHFLFEVFYYCHVVFVLGMICCAYFHSGYLVPCLAFLTTGVDMFIRKIIMAQSRYPKKASIKAISDSVIEISFPKLQGFDYNPGQYIYIAVPELSWFEFHPFSISSSPKQSFVTLHIRRVGNWTNALYRLAQKKSEINLLIEGPYGNLSVDLFGNDRYKHVVLVCGGIGLTPMQSICNQLLHEHVKGRRNLESVQLIWVERDPVLMQSVDVVRRSSSIIMSSRQIMSLDGIFEENGFEVTEASLQEEAYQGHSVPLASTLLSMVPPSNTTDTELEKLYESQLGLQVTDEEEAAYAAGMCEVGRFAWHGSTEFLDISESYAVDFNPGDEESDHSEFDDHTSVGTEAFPCPRNPDNGTALDYKPLNQVFDLRVHLTGSHADHEHQQHALPFVRRGRPQLAQILAETKQQAKETGHKRVAVLVCSPPGIAKICRKACIKLSDRKVRLDYHVEGFS